MSSKSYFCALGKSWVNFLSPISRLVLHLNRLSIKIVCLIVFVLLTPSHNKSLQFKCLIIFVFHVIHEKIIHRCDSIQGTDYIANSFFLNLRVSRTNIENLRWQFGGDII